MIQKIDNFLNQETSYTLNTIYLTTNKQTPTLLLELWITDFQNKDIKRLGCSSVMEHAQGSQRDPQHHARKKKSEIKIYCMLVAMNTK